MIHVLLSISLFLSILSAYGIAELLHGDRYKSLSVPVIILIWTATSASWGIYSYLL